MNAEQTSRAELNAALHDWQFDNMDICLKNDAMFLLQHGSGKPLKDMTKKELYELAKQMEIKGRSHMAKFDLIKAIRLKNKKSSKNLQKR